MLTILFLNGICGPTVAKLQLCQSRHARSCSFTAMEPKVIDHCYRLCTSACSMYLLGKLCSTMCSCKKLKLPTSTVLYIPITPQILRPVSCGQWVTSHSCYWWAPGSTVLHLVLHNRGCMLYTWSHIEKARYYFLLSICMVQRGRIPAPLSARFLWQYQAVF